MTWFKRIKSGILTKTIEKKEAPDGVWIQCKACKTTVTQKELQENLMVCPHCNHHERIGSQAYFNLLFDGQDFEEYFTNLQSIDFLKFKDLKSYEKRLKESKKKTGLDDAIRVAKGEIGGKPAVIAAMDFTFIGGSMGSVMGEKISRAIQFCIDHRTPLIIISKSGGARMMESAFSLMQMAKTSAMLSKLAKEKIPFISFLTDPTTGGVSASFAMLGDILMSEPKALIGFAGPRVIKETIKRDLPEGFQRAEFLLDKGFLDFIVERKLLKDSISQLLRYFAN